MCVCACACGAPLTHAHAHAQTRASKRHKHTGRARLPLPLLLPLLLLLLCSSIYYLPSSIDQLCYPPLVRTPRGFKFSSTRARAARALARANRRSIGQYGRGSIAIARSYALLPTKFKMRCYCCPPLICCSSCCSERLPTLAPPAHQPRTFEPPQAPIGRSSSQIESSI